MIPRTNSENLKGRDKLEELGMDSTKMYLEETEWDVWAGFIWLRIQTNIESSEYGTEASGSTKNGDFLTSGATIKLP